MILGTPPYEIDISRKHQYQREPDPCPSCEGWRNSRNDGAACFRESVLDRGVTPNSKATRFELAWECPECKERWWKFRKVEGRSTRPALLRDMRITYPKDPAAAAEVLSRLSRKVVLEDEASPAPY